MSRRSASVLALAWLSACTTVQRDGSTGTGSVGGKTPAVEDRGSKLVVGEAKGSPGQTVAVPLTLEKSAGADIASLSVEIKFDDSKLTFAPAQTIAGATAVAAAKQVAASSPSPGVARVLIFGLNRDVLSDGEVASLSFVIGDQTIETSRISDGKIDAASATAKTIPVIVQGGVIHVAL